MLVRWGALIRVRREPGQGRQRMGWIGFHQNRQPFKDGPIASRLYLVWGRALINQNPSHVFSHFWVGISQFQSDILEFSDHRDRSIQRENVWLLYFWLFCKTKQKITFFAKVCTQSFYSSKSHRGRRGCIQAGFVVFRIALYGYTNNQTRDIISNVFIDYRILKSVRPNVNFFSRAVRYLPKQALNNIPSLCVYYDLNGCDLQIK